MIFLVNPHRRWARDLARVGALVSAAMVVFGLATTFEPGGRASAAAVNAGAAQILVPNGPTAGQPLTSGGSATAFALVPPVGASCSGDSATDGYRVQTYMVPADVDPSSLTYDSVGPIPTGTGTGYRQPMFSSGGTPFIDQNTAVSTGLLTGFPSFSFGLFGVDGPQILPAGTYNLGFACTKGLTSATQLDKYWNMQITIAVTPSDVPSGLTWTVPAAQAATTTTTTTTSTTVAGTTTTTLARATTTSARSTTTTTTIASTGSSTTTTAVLSGSGSGGSGAGGGGGSIVSTGSSTVAIVVWAILFLVFGRMALLLGRHVRVLPPESR